MPSLRFKGKVFGENLHLGVPFHELRPVRAKGLSKKASLHDNLIVEGDNLAALKALQPTCRGKVMRFEIVDEDEWEQRLNAMLAA